MKKLLRTLLYFTSVFLISNNIAYGQDVQEEVKKDTVTVPTRVEYYGLRVGIDLSKPIRSIIDDNYKGLEIVGDFRIKKNYYVAAAIGNETRTIELPNINNTTRGSYIKAGVNYNAYENWLGMNNLLYAGIYGGFSTFSQELESYSIYTSSGVFPNEPITESQDFTSLSGAWLELKIGLEVELFANLYIGINAQLKRTIITTEPDDYANLFIPGFGKVTEGSSVGVGYGYTISYLIPIFKK